MTAKVRQPRCVGRSAKLARCPISCEKGTVPLADRLVIKTLINNPRELNAKIRARTIKEERGGEEREKRNRLGSIINRRFFLEKERWDTCPVRFELTQIPTDNKSNKAPNRTRLWSASDSLISLEFLPTLSSMLYPNFAQQLLSILIVKIFEESFFSLLI